MNSTPQLSSKLVSSFPHSFVSFCLKKNLNRSTQRIAHLRDVPAPHGLSLFSSFSMANEIAEEMRGAPSFPPPPFPPVQKINRNIS